MKKFHLIVYLFAVLVLSANKLEAQYNFIPNVGQWKEHFDFKVNLTTGGMFFTRNEIYTSLLSMDDLNKLHKASLHKDEKHSSTELPHSLSDEASVVNGFAYKVVFLNATTRNIEGNDKQTAYHNYFLGNDKSRWKGHVSLFNGLTYNEIYKDINLVYFNAGKNMKYEFRAAPGADISKIQMKYEGAHTHLDHSGNFIIETTLGDERNGSLFLSAYRR